ncbi:MAG: LemA family protein, partial [Deltaproteobacteria bacterium]|nr:LemA family protein [Deltaproteobacteria bacterium]
MSKGIKTLLIVIGVIVVLGIIILSWGIGNYNRAVTMDERVDSQWAQVENQLKRRYDLIPNLVETVKGYASHEKELFENIAKMRTLYFQAKSVGQKIKASQGLEGVLSRLLLLKEAYPQLKANESFLKLQDSLEGT